jgi:hypothetical protein
VVLGDGHRELVDHGLELVEVEVLELERVDDHDRLALHAEGPVHHLGGVELEERPVELLTGALGQIHDLEAEGHDGTRDRNREASELAGLDDPDARLGDLVR